MGLLCDWDRETHGQSQEPCADTSAPFCPGMASLQASILPPSRRACLVSSHPIPDLPFTPFS